jgi:DNA-binding MarR family transcriptional regulator
MQLLQSGNRTRPLEACAEAVMETGLLVGRLVRAQAWSHRASTLSDVQLRTLTLINAHPDCAPSGLADYMLLSRPAITRVVDELVAQRLVARQPGAADRRRVALRVTAAGRRRVEAHLAGARAALAERLADLSPAERATVLEAMAILGPRLVPPALGGPATATGETGPAR